MKRLLRRSIHIDMAVKTQLCSCNIQGVGVCTNVSANYMFRPLPVRPSSGWTSYLSLISQPAPNLIMTTISLL